MTERPEAVDVVVVGAGPAGATSAAVLAELGWRVVLLDRHRQAVQKPCSEYVGPGAAPLFRRLGLERRLGIDFGQRLAGMELIAPGGARALLTCGSARAAAPAYSLPRARLDAALVEVAAARGAAVRCGYRVDDLLEASGVVRGVAGSSDAGRFEIAARLVIGADGRYSIVRQRIGAARTERGVCRVGLTTRFDGVCWPEPFGRMYVGQTGYVGAAPSGDGSVVVGAAVRAPQGRWQADELFQDAVRGHAELASRLSTGRPCESVRGVRSLSSAVDCIAKPGVLLVGDAAGTVDPFTGEGISRALHTGWQGAQFANHALREGSYRRLHGYRRWRRQALAPKERLLQFIQVCLEYPALMDRVVRNLERGSKVGPMLANVLGDLSPVSRMTAISMIWGLMKP